MKWNFPETLFALAQYSSQDAARSSAKYETPGQALVHERVLPASPTKKMQISQHEDLELQWSSAFSGDPEFSRGQKESSKYHSNTLVQSDILATSQEVWTVTIGFPGKGHCLFRVRSCKAAVWSKRALWALVAISVLWAAWSQGSCVIPGSFMFAPSEGHSQALSVTSGILTLFITHPSGSARVRERAALYLWVPLPAGAEISRRNSKWRKNCVSTESSFTRRA